MIELDQDLHALGRIALAGALAAVIGLERELARRPAGLRTHLLVGLASSLLIVLGRSVTEEFATQPGVEGVKVDPIRILQAVVVGISFLGAGTIVHDQNGRVEGLTTAASILLAAAIGAAVTLDRVFLAIVMTAVVTGVLFVLGRLEVRLGLDSPPVAGSVAPKARGASRHRVHGDG